MRADGTFVFFMLVVASIGSGRPANGAQPANASGSNLIIVARQTSPVATSPDAEARTSRTNEPRSCARVYYDSLKTIEVSAGGALQTSADTARRGRADLPRYWLFWQPGQSAVRRKLARIGAPSVIVVEDRICTRSVLGRGGRIRCLKWEPKPKNFKPPPAATFADEKPKQPPPHPQALKRIRALSGIVGSGGAVGELRRPGRLYQLTKRVGGELLGYLGQSFHPNLCTGGSAMVGFYARQLTPLTKRMNTATGLANAAQQFAREQVVRALDAWKSNGATQIVSTDNDQAPDVSKVPAGLGDMVVATAKVMLPRDLVKHIEDETDDFARLVRAREAMSADAATEAPTHVYHAVFSAFRAIEIAFYADVGRQTFNDYGAALERLIRSVGDSHEKNCTCE